MSEPQSLCDKETQPLSDAEIGRLLAACYRIARSRARKVRQAAEALAAQPNEGKDTP